jgi:hypothetical protein
MERARAIFWSLGLAAILAAGAPALAQAHAGHSHHATAHHVAGHLHEAHIQPTITDTGEKVSALAGTSLNASIPVQNDPSTDSGCNDRGCCTAGHCTSCAALIAPFAGGTWPPATDAAYGRFLALALANGPSDRLRRPPRSLS